MHALTTGHGHRTNRSVHVTSWVDHRYLNSLRPTGLESVPLLELLHTVFPDVAATSVATLAKVVDATDLATDLYRDGHDTLVVLRHDSTGPILSLLWPIALRPCDPTDATAIVGYRGTVFLVDTGDCDVVPLPAATPGRSQFGWGRPGPETINLYLALVHCVHGRQAPIPRPQFQDHPESLYGWLIRQDPARELRLRWPDAVRMVKADEPLRAAARNAAAHRPAPSGAAQATMFPAPLRATRAVSTTR